MYNNELKSLGNVEVKEFMLSKDGYNLIGFLGKGTHYNWLSLPLCISVELSDFHDDFWNTEQLASSLDDFVLIDLLICTIHDLDHLFGKLSRTVLMERTSSPQESILSGLNANVKAFQGS